MKAERQQKESQKAEPIQSKRERFHLSFEDNRSQTASQTKLIHFIQKKENKIKLSDDLKTDMGNLSSFSMDDVRVHYDSDKPAQLNALAYAQRKVQPTIKMQGININDNIELKKEVEGVPKSLKYANTNPLLKSNSLNHRIIQKMMGFGANIPTGYGTVSLTATLNGTNLGASWSRFSIYLGAAEHAEEAVIDYIEYLEVQCDLSPDTLSFQELTLAQGLEHQKNLVINNLTASPCSSEPRGDFGVITCNKADGESGCTEKLIELADRGYNITIYADHYYQPHIQGAKSASIAAVQALREAGIVVYIAHP